jgi:hypothetical protein
MVGKDNTPMKTVATWICALVAAIHSQQALSAPINIAVDIDSTAITSTDLSGPIETQTGFTSWDCTPIFESQDLSKVVDSITFTIFGTRLFGSGLRTSRYITSDFPGDFLLRDFVFSNSVPEAIIGLRIAGLDVGRYSMKTWHYDGHLNVLSEQKTVRIFASNMGQALGAPIVDYVFLRPEPVEFQFDVTSPGQVKEIIVRGLDTRPAARLNGFTLTSVPEPSAMALLTLALTPIAARRRRSTAQNRV